MGFPREEYWRGLPFLSPGDFPDPGIEPGAPILQADFFFFNRLSYEGSPEEAESSKYTHKMVNPGTSASSPVGKLRSAVRPGPRVRGVWVARVVETVVGREAANQRGALVPAVWV